MTQPSEQNNRLPSKSGGSNSQADLLSQGWIEEDNHAWNAYNPTQPTSESRAEQPRKLSIRKSCAKLRSRLRSTTTPIAEHSPHVLNASGNRDLSPSSIADKSERDARHNEFAAQRATQDAIPAVPTLNFADSTRGSSGKFHIGNLSQLRIDTSLLRNINDAAVFDSPIQEASDTGDIPESLMLGAAQPAEGSKRNLDGAPIDISGNLVLRAAGPTEGLLRNVSAFGTPVRETYDTFDTPESQVPESCRPIEHLLRNGNYTTVFDDPIRETYDTIRSPESLVLDTARPSKLLVRNINGNTVVDSPVQEISVATEISQNCVLGATEAAEDWTRNTNDATVLDDSVQDASDTIDSDLDLSVLGSARQTEDWIRNLSDASVFDDPIQETFVDIDMPKSLVLDATRRPGVLENYSYEDNGGVDIYMGVYQGACIAHGIASNPTGKDNIVLQNAEGVVTQQDFNAVQDLAATAGTTRALRPAPLRIPVQTYKADDIDSDYSNCSSFESFDALKYLSKEHLINASNYETEILPQLEAQADEVMERYTASNYDPQLTVRQAKIIQQSTPIEVDLPAFVTTTDRSINAEDSEEVPTESEFAEVDDWIDDETDTPVNVAMRKKRERYVEMRRLWAVQEAELAVWSAQVRESEAWKNLPPMTDDEYLDSL